MKIALLAAFDELGGVPKLVEWAGKNQGEFYKIWSRLIPQEMKHSGSIGTFDASKFTNEQLDQLESILGPIAAASGDAEGDPSGEGPSRR